MTEVHVIESDTHLDDVDHHLRVFAGPGAGKTFWLVKHIKDVLARSNRLTAPAKIACISYTNVAAGNILQELGPSADRVDVSTIHSFFYRHIVRPYLHLVKDNAGNSAVDYVQVDGHDEHRPTFGAVKDWLAAVGKKNLHRFFAANCAEWFRYLKSLSWRRDEKTAQWSMNPIGGWKQIPEYLPTTQLGSYKAVYWQRGIIDHEDVLYFAYRILEENPGLLPFLAARCPYLFIDEFQDTNPVQTQVTKWLADAGTIVGVIGDVEQAIFSFQGSRYEDFKTFSLPGQIDYEIQGNRRSTDSIIAFLNHSRGDNLTQKGIRKIVGEPVRVLVGSHLKSFDETQRLVGDKHLTTILSRKNDTVNAIRRSSGLDQPDPWPTFEEADTDRARFFWDIVGGGELAWQKQFNLGIRRILRGLSVRKGQFRRPIIYENEPTELQRRALAVGILEFLITHHGELADETLLVAYGKIEAVMSQTLSGLRLTGVRKGKFKSFAESTAYRDLVASVRLVEDTRTIRTIHKAKGAEFDSVLVVLTAEEELGRVLRPNDVPKREQEERRITYVGLSRARNCLMISVPCISEQNRAEVVAMGAEVVKC